MSKFVTLWFWQKERLTAEWFEVYSYTTNEFPHPYLTRQSKPPTNAQPWSWSSVDENNHLVAHVPTSHTPDAPAMWYALVREYGKLKQSQTLVAFNTDHYAEGTVVEVDELKSRGFDPSFMSQRIAAIRWGFGDPHIEQLFVDQNHRRKRISIRIINVADVVNVAGNWGGFIYGGDQVTDLGEQLRGAWSNSARVQNIVAKMPPMDKGN